MTGRYGQPFGLGPGAWAFVFSVSGLAIVTVIFGTIAIQVAMTNQERILKEQYGPPAGTQHRAPVGYQPQPQTRVIPSGTKLTAPTPRVKQDLHELVDQIPEEEEMHPQQMR